MNKEEEKKVYQLLSDAKIDGNYENIKRVLSHIYSRLLPIHNLKSDDIPFVNCMISEIIDEFCYLESHDIHKLNFILDKAEIYLDMIDCSLFSDFKVINKSYFVNIYLFCKYSQKMRDVDFLEYQEVSDKYSIPVRDDINYEFIYSLMRLDDFFSESFISNLLDKYLFEIKDFDIKIVNTILQDVFNLKDSYNIDSDNVSNICEQLLNNNMKFRHYFSFLLINDRFNYLIDAVSSVEANPNLENVVIDSISSSFYNDDFFEYINQKHLIEGDSFHFIIDAILDSDTYTEMLKKLKFLCEIKSFHFRKNLVNLKNNLFLLKSDEFKDEFLDKKIMITDQNKPQKILDRTRLCYQTLFPQYDFRNVNTDCCYNINFLDLAYKEFIQNQMKGEAGNDASKVKKFPFF